MTLILSVNSLQLMFSEIHSDKLMQPPTYLPANPGGTCMKIIPTQSLMVVGLKITPERQYHAHRSQITLRYMERFALILEGRERSLF